MGVDYCKGLIESRCLVIKIGSTLLVSDDGQLNQSWLDGLCQDVAELRGQGTSVVLVSSGAIALGARSLTLDRSRARLEESQAAAAAGQIQLAHAYQNALSAFQVPVAQVLLTLDDSEDRRRYLNARGTLTTLLKRGVVPVVNENDTVATSEIRYGDNDRLAARVAQMVSAAHLLLLSDVDGLYQEDPLSNPAADHIPLVHSVDASIRAMAAGSGSGLGSGGMHTKLDAAAAALAAGCNMVITSGHVNRPVAALLAGARATWFVASESPRTARKQWIAGTLQPRGMVQVDAGADRALKAGKSLLPAGVTHVEGQFGRGDAVSVVRGGQELARGLIAYPAHEARQIAGLRSEQVSEVLGYRGRDELIHRDDLVLTRE